jgi:hypothetical protein
MKRSAIIIVIILIVISFFAGMHLGPRISLQYWTYSLDHNTDPWVKLKAASKITGLGYDAILYDRLESHDAVVRNISIAELGNNMQTLIMNPIDLSILVPKQYPKDKLYALSFADSYSEQYKKTVGYLKYKINHPGNDELKKAYAKLYKEYSLNNSEENVLSR